MKKRRLQPWALTALLPVPSMSGPSKVHVCGRLLPGNLETSAWPFRRCLRTRGTWCSRRWTGTMCASLRTARQVPHTSERPPCMCMLSNTRHLAFCCACTWAAIHAARRQFNNPMSASCTAHITNVHQESPPRSCAENPRPSCMQARASRTRSTAATRTRGSRQDNLLGHVC